MFNQVQLQRVIFFVLHVTFETFDGPRISNLNPATSTAFPVRPIWLHPASIEWFIEYQAFSLSYDLAPPPPPTFSPVRKLSLFLSRPVCSPVELTDERWGEVGWGRSQVTRRRESLVLCKLFHTLWLYSCPLNFRCHDLTRYSRQSV